MGMVARAAKTEPGPRNMELLWPPTLPIIQDGSAREIAHGRHDLSALLNEIRNSDSSLRASRNRHCSRVESALEPSRELAGRQDGGNHRWTPCADRQRLYM